MSQANSRTDPKEGLYGATKMIGKLCDGDWIFGLCLISDLDLPLEFFVPWPLMYTKHRHK